MILSLFPGLGLLDDAFEAAGFTIVPRAMGDAVARAVREATT